MIHPKFTAVGDAFSPPRFLASIGPYGSWGDLSWITRWGEGACGMFEASWTMPLPPDFEHPLLRRGSLVELMMGGIRVGSPLTLTEPARGTGLDDPWQFTATGIGREVEGVNSFYALDGSNNTTTVGTTAVDWAIARGWRIGGRDANIPASGPTAQGSSEALNTVGTLLTSIAQLSNQRWGVGDDNLVRLLSDPMTPTWHVTPTQSAMGVADDDYATLVLGRYINSADGLYATAFAPGVISATETRYGRREFPVDLTPLGPISTASAQAFADGILTKSKGRLGWTNGLTLTSNELLTSGGVPADLTMVEAGQMVRIHGTFDDLLQYTGQPYLDIIIGETKYTDGAQTIEINPLGLAARDLAAVVESVTGRVAA